MFYEPQQCDINGFQWNAGHSFFYFAIGERRPFIGRNACTRKLLAASPVKCHLIHNFINGCVAKLVTIFLHQAVDLL